MRHATAAVLLVSALGLLGCGESHEQTKKPVPAGLQGSDEVNYVNDRVDPIGRALVSFHRAAETRRGPGLPTLTVALRVECPKEAQPLTIKGAAADGKLISDLGGPVHSPDPAGGAMTFSLRVHGGQTCRGLSRAVTRTPEAAGRPTGEAAVTLNPGQAAYLWYEVERPDRDAAVIMLDIRGEDVGHVGLVMVGVPPDRIARE